MAAVVSLNMNQSIVPMSKKSITKLLFDESKDDIMDFINRANKNEQEQIDLMIRYLATVYVLAGLISINYNKLKSSESILTSAKLAKEDRARDAEVVSGGAQLKDELISALKIVQGNLAFKRIGVTDDKIKTMLITTFKFMNRTFSNETIVLKSRTPRERCEFDILSSPVSYYANYMANRNGKHDDLIDIVGVKLDSLFPKSKKATPITTHALYTNIYNPKIKESTERGRYVQESYNSIVEFVSQEPIIGRFTSIQTPPKSKSIRDYEAKQYKRIKLDQSIPIRFLPVENSREYDFRLKNYQIGYCLSENGTVRPHRWSVVNNKSKLIFTCRYCDLDIEKASKSNNDKIEDGLDDQMSKEAFFELYTLACPIKNAHVFESNECTQCSVTIPQLEGMDQKYYKKYSSIYEKHRVTITTDMINAANFISTYSTPVGKISSNDIIEKPDLVKLESLASSLSKLYNRSNLKSIGTDSTSNRSLEIIESYVRMFYSHYTFVKNISIDTKNHPDIAFFSFIKKSFFDGVKPKQIKLPNLPEYPSSLSADQLLIKLFQIIYDLASNSDTNANVLVKYIVSKMLDQDDRRKAFNFAKLKAGWNPVETEEDNDTTAIEEGEEEEFDIFNGYDMDNDDIEDNIDGDID